MKKVLLAYCLGLATVAAGIASAQFVVTSIPSVDRVVFAKEITLTGGKSLSITIDGVTQSKTVPAGKTLQGFIRGEFTLE